MNDDYQYVGVPATTQEMMENKDHDHPVESSETHTLPEPEAPAALDLGALMVVGPFLILLSMA